MPNFLKKIIIGCIEMGELSKLPNIGKVVEEQLNEVGINTVDDLIDIGSKEAWLKIKEIDDSACINRLMALEGAIQNIRWHDLSEDDKNNLKEFYNNFK
ncbi:TfoX/Sxy family protein [Methanobrevibacter sp.]|uniref:TfoX/Sxy family protein n=1 Tax=Methanobrevibacter sp. TaxID=66852 RepID=UPI0025F1CDC2|nr:TfoX/Sxy family protein [Methanobrevibacter sp.]MBR4447090.1 TfoX/Sxy family protein [Methanobrevibacter sp.]